jgi:predicted nucleotidyltransferase
MMSDTRTLVRSVGREELLRELRAMRHRFEHAGVTHMTLFGSRARGDNRLDSDLDLAVDIAPDRKFSLIDLSRLHLIAEDGVHLRANIHMRRSLAPGLRIAVSRDGIAVF